MLKKLKLQYKILSIPGLVVIVATITTISIHMTIRQYGSILDEMTARNIPAWETVGVLEDNLSDIQQAFENALLLKSAEKINEADLLYEDFQKRIRLLSADSTAQWGGLSESAGEYYTLVKSIAEQHIQGRSRDEMTAAVQNITSQYSSLQERLRLARGMHMDLMQENLAKAKNRYNKSVATVYISLALMLPIIFVLAVLILSSIIKSLKVIIDVAERVAEGDMTVQVPETDAKDEIGVLTQKTRVMISNLRELTLQIKEAANSLAAASSEISASVTQIAAGATETATAANETSTTVEEVRQTALDSSRKAKYVSDSAQKAVQISQNGEKAVNTMVDGMNRIESQMASIAESILKLSEHGQAIGGIIATVEDVAEQSNLLAVNASIEAAKAGEQGKGFAVVAMEVKSLAEQSRQATTRVRSILDDIQKATGGAVLVAEQGSKAVESGVEMSSNAGDAIQRLANSVTEAAQATTQIAVSSQEQLVGMDQVVSAMESIKQASTQNVTATKQVESAAHDLHELGQNLKHLVEQYRV